MGSRPDPREKQAPHFPQNGTSDEILARSVERAELESVEDFPRSQTAESLYSASAGDSIEQSLERLSIKDQAAPRFSDYAGSATYTEFYQNVKPTTAVRFWFESLLKTFSQDRLKKELIFNVIGKGKKEKDLETVLMELVCTICLYAGDHLFIRNTSKTPILRPSARHEPASMPDGCVFLTKDTPTHGAHVVAVFDLKKEKKKPQRADIGQVLSYCHRILAVEQPFRKEVSAFVLNNRWIQFVRVRNTNPRGRMNFTYEMTPPVSVVRESFENDVPKGLQWLYVFFCAGFFGLGFEDIDNPFDSEYVHTALLGVGVSTQGVYAIDQHPDYVLKLFKTNEARGEATMLKQLENLDVPHVPKLIKEHDRALILSPRCEHIYHITCHQALQLLETLQHVHKHGFVHRDIRPANLLVQRNGSILVNDWGFTVPIDTEQPYAGTLIHASDAVLKKLSEGQANIRVTAADDLVSFVRTVFVLTFPHAAPRLNISKTKYFSHDAKKVLQMWNVSRKLPEKWRDLQNMAAKGDHEEVRKVLPQLIP